MIKRSDKLAFIGATSENAGTFTRLKGFTELSMSKNPKEYSRQYVDEEAERTDIIGYAPELSYAFDEFEDDNGQKIITEITNKELIGDAAKVDIVIVDLSRESGSSGAFEAVKRTFSVMPDSEGGSTDAYTYSGTLKANGEKVFGTATSGADGSWKTCKFTVAAE